MRMCTYTVPFQNSDVYRSVLNGTNGNRTDLGAFTLYSRTVLERLETVLVASVNGVIDNTKNKWGNLQEAGGGWETKVSFVVA